MRNINEYVLQSKKLSSIDEYVLQSKKLSLVNEYVSKDTISSIDEYVLQSKKLSSIDEYVLQSKKLSLVNEYVSKDTISSIDEYLLSKKHPNASSHAIQDEYCLVGAYGEAYRDLVYEYVDCMIESEAGLPNLFLMKKHEIRAMLEDHENQIIVYKIPSKFNTLSDMDKFQEEYNKGMHDPDGDLEEILPEDL